MPTSGVLLMSRLSELLSGHHDFERYRNFFLKSEARFDRQDDESARAHFDLFILSCPLQFESEVIEPNKISWELTDSNVLEANRGLGNRAPTLAPM